MQIQPGIPFLLDIKKLRHSKLYRSMLRYDESFTERHRASLKQYGMRWLVNPMRNWSRQWEYPFAASHILPLASGLKNQRIHILDAGSGITFFPYYLCDNVPKAEVICCDCNTSYGKIYTDINQSFDKTSIRFIHSELQNLPLSSRSLDAVYCISVLEHTNDYAEILDEFRRVLKPGGLLVITFDISLDGRCEVSRDGATHLIKLVTDRFVGKIDFDYLKQIERLDQQERILTTDHISKTEPDLLPWKFPLLKSIYDFIKGRGWSGGFFSLTCYGLAVRAQ